MIQGTKSIFISGFLFLLFANVSAQSGNTKFTHADTLRGSMNAERQYDVLKYDISFTPDFLDESIQGSNTITYKALESSERNTTKILNTDIIQIDLQEPLTIDSILNNQTGEKLSFTREGNAFHVNTVSPESRKRRPSESCLNCERSITVFFQGHPSKAAKAPWFGGFIFTKDSLGRPWMSVACEGTGASVWYPCKDYLGDEPDHGATLTMTVPDSLIAIGNGRLIKKISSSKGLTSWTWGVMNPINNYNIVPYIGKYVNWKQTHMGMKGNLECSFWVLDYNLKKSKKHFLGVDSMLSCFEYWFGPYPFYEDSYKLIESPYLGMEHQSAIAYGNQYKQGYHGIDLSETGWGLKWDFIIVHESGHEWFGNNITCKDIADEWIHESFTNYSETLYTGFYFGKPAGDAYCIGTRKQIVNGSPIIRFYGVNAEPEGNDQYYKGGNMIHMIRQIIRNDELFRRILRGMNQHFYHQTVTAMEIQQYINKLSGIDFTPVFDQYLRNTSIPELQYKFEGNYLIFRWANCIPGFNMPVRVDLNGEHWLSPTTEWKKEKYSKTGSPMLVVDRNFYVEQQNLTVRP